MNSSQTFLNNHCGELKGQANYAGGVFISSLHEYMWQLNSERYGLLIQRLSV